jgi:hypothetical protein
MDEILATEVIPTAIKRHFFQLNLTTAGRFKFLRSILTADEAAGIHKAKVKCGKLRALISCASAENRPTHFFRLPRAGSLSQII